jgi:nucleotide-binding universal stress UspA family protein
MRVLVWIVEDTWRATVAAAAAFLPADADITLLYVTASEAEAVARGARNGLLGRPHRAPAEPLQVISEQSARDLLAEAQQLLGCQARRGRVEREVVAAAEEMDLLVLARDRGRAYRGPRSLGSTARFVVEHSPCAVLLVWPDGTAPGARNGGEYDQRIDS